MPRDYKSRAVGRKRRKRKAIPGPVWFLGGLLVGLFFSGLAWLKLLPPEGGSGQARPEPAAQESHTAGNQERGPAPRFDFYTILPEMEVVVPEPEPEPVAVVAAPAPASGKPPVVKQTSARSDSYMLQMGSFRKYSDADRLKASLALVGIRAEIQKVRINSKDTFHRVRAGPYSRDKVNLLRARLKQNNISSLVIKLKR